MEAKNLSISTLERRAGLSTHSIRNILNGKVKKLNLDTLRAVATVLECSLVDLINTLPSSSDRIIHPITLKRRSQILLDNHKLMLKCCKIVSQLILNKDHVLSVYSYLDVVESVYFYALSEEPQKLDSKFAKWVVDMHIDLNP